jgi:hypothetical protein
LMSFNGDLDEQDVHMAMDLRRRHISQEQMRTFEGDVAAIFSCAIYLKQENKQR